MRHASLHALLILLAAAFAPNVAWAQAVCMTPAEFNDYAARSGGAAVSGTLTMRFESRDMNVVPGEKSVLVDFVDTRRLTPESRPCGEMTVKTWNDCRLADGSRCICSGSPCSGKIKMEAGDACVTPPTGETWADPLHSEPVFVSDMGMCDATVWFDPDALGYTIRCDNAPAPVEGRGPNAGHVRINEIFLLSFWTGGSPFDTRIESAQFCFVPETPAGDGGMPAPDAGGPVPITLDFPVMQDVTADGLNPGAVYPVETDLSIADGESEVYLGFQVDALPGRVTRAELLVHSAAAPSSEGTGFSVFRAVDAPWSEHTLTWSTRPGRVGPRLARVAPVAADQLYTVDLGDAAIAAGANSFVLAPEAGDSNGVHLDSKEAAGMRGAVLRLTIDPTQPMTSDAGAPVTDSGVTALDAGAGDDAGSARDGGSRRDAGGVVTDSGCACRSRPASPSQGGGAIAALGAALAVALAARRRHFNRAG